MPRPGAYHIVVVDEAFYCTATATNEIAQETVKNSCTSLAFATAYTTDGYVSALSKIDNKNTFNKLSYAIENEVDANGKCESVTGKATAKGMITFKILMDATDINSIVQADFSAYDTLVPPYSYNSLITNLNGTLSVRSVEGPADREFPQ